MEIHLAHTFGFCAGVTRAVETVNQAIETYGTPIYVRHHIVHNTTIINDFESRGVVFIDTLDQVPEGKVVIISAHGAGPLVYKKAEERQLVTIDATCPLVKKVHKNAKRFSEENIPTILIGHKTHQELVGTSSYINKDRLSIVEDEGDIADINLDPFSKVAVLTQTTLSVDDTKDIVSKLKKTYPNLIAQGNGDICYATQHRQQAVSELAETCDAVIICGSPNSSNSNRLMEKASNYNIPAYIIDNELELQPSWLKGIEKVGISSGASVPDVIVSNVIKKITAWYPDSKIFRAESKEKDIFFKLPQI